MNQIAMDRWATVKHIHQCALDRDPSDRPALLTKHVAGTRRFVEKCSRF